VRHDGALDFCAVTARVACVGIAVLDQVWAVESLPAGPGKHRAQAVRESGGGMAATAAVAVAALGGRAVWHGRLGADSPGAIILALLARHGVDTAGTEPTPGARTPVAGVFVDGAGERMIAVFTGANLPAAPCFDATWLDGAGAVLGDPRWPEGTERLFRLAEARGLPRVLDAEMSAVEAVRRLAPLADHVIFSRQGLAEFIGPFTGGLADAAALLPHATLAVTRGEHGSLWWRDGAAVALPAPNVTARDTTGCGDVFHGAYALALAEGRTVPDAARFATAAAALKAERGDGWDGMPDRPAVDALLRRGWP
jgi:sulfofructose kinase